MCDNREEMLERLDLYESVLLWYGMKSLFPGPALAALLGNRHPYVEHEEDERTL